VKNRVSQLTASGKLTNRRSPHARGVAKIATPLILGLVALGIAATPALAAEQWGAVGAFGSGGSGAGQFKQPSGVAVNNATTGPNAGDVYVVDKGNNRVEWFDSAGKYEGQFNGSATPAKAFSNPEGIAVDNSDPSSPSFGDVYVTDTGNDVIDKFEANGKYLGQITKGSGGTAFSGLLGVAVDPYGVVWVYEGIAANEGGEIVSYTDALVNVLASEHKSQQAAYFAEPGFAVDSNDNAYVVYRGSRIVAKLNSAGEGTAGEVFGGVEGVSGVAVDPASNDVYIDDGTSVAAFSPAESPIENFGEGLLGGAGSLAVNPTAGTSGYAYVAEPGANEVLFFQHSVTPLAAPATPVTEKVELVTATSATLDGKLNPGGAQGGVGYYFSYHAGAGSSCTEPGSVSTPFDNGGTNLIGDSPISVETTVTGLEPNVEYVFCLVAYKSKAATGSQEPFTTLPAAPEVISESASSTFAEEANYPATLEANVNPENEETTYHFEYSTEGSVSENKLENAQNAPEEPFPTISGFGEQHVEAVGVPMATTGTIYYRVVATNTNGGTTTGNVQAYTKLPFVENEKVSALTSTSARAEATVNPVFILGTKYEFEYATEAAELGTSQATVVGKSELPELPEKELNKPFSVDGELISLRPGENYYYRAVAENAVSRHKANANGGKPVDGPIESFTTYTGPSATTGEVQNITGTSATLSGEVDPKGAETSYSFEYISEPAYQAALAKGTPNPSTEGETTAPVSAGSGEGTQAAGPTPVSGLLPGTTYRYELVATNRYGVQGVGKEETFTTLGSTPPVVTTGGVSNVSQNSATLLGTVSTSGLQTEYGFEIGTTPNNYGPVTGLGSIGGSTTETVSLTLGELQPGTTYYYRVTASSVDGTREGQPESFTTPGFPTLIAPPASPPLVASPSIAFPKEEKPNGTTVKTLTNKERLAAALKQCKKDKSKSKKAKCEKAAKKKYPVAKEKKAGKKK